MCSGSYQGGGCWVCVTHLVEHSGKGTVITANKNIQYKIKKEGYKFSCGSVSRPKSKWIN